MWFFAYRDKESYHGMAYRLTIANNARNRIQAAFLNTVTFARERRKATETIR